MTPEQLSAALNGIPDEQIQSALDLDNSSDKEDADWLKALQTGIGAKNTSTTPTTGLLNGKYGILIVGGIVFVAALALYSFYGKKKK